MSVQKIEGLLAWSSDKLIAWWYESLYVYREVLTHVWISRGKLHKLGILSILYINAILEKKKQKQKKLHF